ncbi:recombinase family protein [Phaeobacter inhibens]|uniref:recombinase family protein n=1 Tax=Phaeobacter inhibens TaxID=221822 RepID=UPI0021A8BB03|nr:recombinase family protein [Phaeobacter inhibens]UWR78113.1 recombinase family protein [Phaeobacter inhibens]
MARASRPKKAVIYTRVSGAKQVREGDGLASQENRCREYATYKDYDVVEVFSDDMSGKFERRPAMDRMLAFLRLHPKNSVVVIIDDISRFARNVQAHIKLRETLSDAGGILESPSIEFGEDSDSRLVEHMLASVAQHQREKNAEQTQNRMRGRMMNGYAVFSAPIGYRFEKAKGHGKLLVRDEPIASIIQEALEGYAAGRFASQAEVKRFFESQPAFPKDLPGGQIRQQKVSDILKRVVYAGYVEHEPWGITRRKGHHEPIISLATYQKVQDRKNARALALAKQNTRTDFPLRGALNCACCDQPMTSCWSRSGTGKRYPYYWCQTRDCSQYRKNIRAEKVDAGFEALLKSLTPSKNLLSIVTSMLSDAWDQRTAHSDSGKAQIKRDIALLDKQQDSLLEKLVDATNAKVVSAYEDKVAKLEDEKLLLTDKLTQNSKPRYTKREIFELLTTFLSNPWNVWEKGNLTLRKNVLRMAFESPLAYDRENGFRTPQASVIFEFLADFTLKCKMVPPHGLEPRTY